MLLGFYPLARMTVFKPDIRKALSISNVERREVNNGLEITGLISNSSSTDWSSVEVEAEFFDVDGRFIDEFQGRLLHVGPNAEEHFKIALLLRDENLREVETTMKVKIVGGHTSPF